MTLSLWGLAGAVIGAALGYVNFRVIIGILEPRLRKLDDSKTAEERGNFERKIAWLRRIFFAVEIVVLGAVGYFVGTLFGG
jgi:hypothetical protein